MEATADQNAPSTRKTAVEEFERTSGVLQGHGKPLPRDAVDSWFVDKSTIEEDVRWLSEGDAETAPVEPTSEWIVWGQLKESPSQEMRFCVADVLENVLRIKQGVFERFSSLELAKARSRANPFETIRSAFFMNRAALKMANIDAATGFMFSDIDRNSYHKQSEGPYYFADVCAGPGGFSEYILWRKRWAFKGFGFTLKGDHDFKLHDSPCCSGVTFQSYYGAAGDGNVFNPDNIAHFADRIMHETAGEGVHFMMADGGFSVEGRENLQEILSKQIYVCQCLTALEIVRKRGHFVTKLFDTFTAFSVGLLFLMHKCFDEVCILKPNSSRPANSERYFVCKHLKDDPIVNSVRKHLRTVVDEFWSRKTEPTSSDIEEIVPDDVIRRSGKFVDYITNTNNRLGNRQTASLLKLAKFAENKSLQDGRQEKYRKDCLACWRIPDEARINVEPFSVEDLISLALRKPAFLYVQPKEIRTECDLNRILQDITDWSYCPLFSCKNTTTCSFYAGVGGSKVFRLQNRNWIRVKNLQLIKGTLLFGEMTLENVLKGECTEEVQIRSLHVIDAIRLGDINIIDLPFSERLSLIRTYCKAVNFETTNKSCRIRAKSSWELTVFAENPEIKYVPDNDSYISGLTTIGYGSKREYYPVNSLLFLKTDSNQLFNTTYVLRAQLFLSDLEDSASDLKDAVTYESLLKYTKSQLHDL